jgi:hypothetical protein
LRASSSRSAISVSGTAISREQAPHTSACGGFSRVQYGQAVLRERPSG